MFGCLLLLLGFQCCLLLCKNIALDNFIALLFLNRFPPRCSEEIRIMRTGVGLVGRYGNRGYGTVRVNNLSGSGRTALQRYILYRCKGQHAFYLKRTKLASRHTVILANSSLIVDITAFRGHCTVGKVFRSQRTLRIA